MRLLLLAGTSLLALAAASAPAVATTFTYTDSVLTYTVPDTGQYEITANGAEGGDNGGLGAMIQGQFALTGTVQPSWSARSSRPAAWASTATGQLQQIRSRGRYVAGLEFLSEVYLNTPHEIVRRCSI